ncbi:MAG: MsnO8 family LLM class oxidoreductase, partial [Dehalococcoidia bacterium]|nr:MsnO8 family LLM class oxidoreductase [Dehalococcoidia bacterium]
YGFLADDFPPDHEYHGIRAMPRPQAMPDLWLLGSSDVSAGYAAELGWPFCYAHFINSHRADSALDAYRKLFAPSPVAPEPRASIAVSALVAETEEEAERLSWSRWGWRLMGEAGRGGIPPPEDALAFEYTEPEREYIDVLKRRSIYGDPQQVRERLLSMGERYGVDDFVVVTITYDYEKRLRSYELLAEAFGLEPRA